jgi:hypothetical protein
MRTKKSVLAALVLMAALSACITKRNAAEEWEAGEYVPDVPISVHVTNHNWADVVIYALRSTTRTRLGQVTSMSEVTFPLPPGVSAGGSDVRLLVDIIGSRAYFLTDMLLLSPGVQVQLWVENHLPASSWAVDFAAEEEPAEAVPSDSTKAPPPDSTASNPTQR